MAPSDRSDPDGAANPQVPAEEAVRAQLDQILLGDDFAQSARLKSFLRYVVHETLAGRGERLKEYAIATEVFQRDEDFDPQTNTIVRVEAGRLRRRLEHYYLTDGRNDAVRIDLPKGTYVPLFRYRRPGLEPPVGTVHSSPADSEPGMDLPAGPSIAVLPFENLSGDPGQDFFADGITEEIINDLTRFPSLRVISRHSTFKYKGQHPDIRDLGRDLNVRFVLEGSVRKGGEILRVTGQLVETAEGTHLFSETYDRDISAQNILEIQDDLADRIVAAVGQPYGVMARSDARLARRRPAESLDAYEAVLRFYAYVFIGAPKLHREVRAALERAVELDPDYSYAWAALAGIYLDESRFGYNLRPKSDPLSNALEAAQRAVTLDPENSMAYHFLFNAHFHKGEMGGFQSAGERAVALNPNHTDMLADFGLTLCCIGDWERGMDLADKAIVLSPSHPGWFHVAPCFHHYHRGDYEAALVEAQRIQMPEFYWTHVLLAMCYGQLGREREASAAGEKLKACAPEFVKQAWDHLAAWNIVDALALRIVDGLQRAGLSIPPQVANDEVL